jgi:hypothetical protein
VTTEYLHPRLHSGLAVVGKVQLSTTFETCATVVQIFVVMIAHNETLERVETI